MKKISQKISMLVMAFGLIGFSSAAHAACSNPAGVEGEQIYNDDNNVMQFCDGTDWTAMKGGSGADNLGNHIMGQTLVTGNNWINGDATVNEGLQIDTNGEIVIDRAGTSYDVWIQGGLQTDTGEARNLAILGVESSDTLYVNYGSEYAAGTRIGGPVLITGGGLSMNANKITGLGTPTASTDAATKAYVDANAGGIASADYDSGWVALSGGNQQVTLTHNQGTRYFKNSMIWGSCGSTSVPILVNGVTSSGSGQYGYLQTFDSNNAVKVRTFPNGGIYSNSCSPTISTHFRLMLWK